MRIEQDLVRPATSASVNLMMMIMEAALHKKTVEGRFSLINDLMTTLYCIWRLILATFVNKHIEKPVCKEEHF